MAKSLLENFLQKEWFSLENYTSLIKIILQWFLPLLLEFDGKLAFDSMDFWNRNILMKNSSQLYGPMFDLYLVHVRSVHGPSSH